MRPHRLLLAGGGTCGHIFPALEIAREFLSRNSDNRVFFVNAGRDADKRELSGFNWQAIDVEGLKGRGLTRKLISLSKLPKAHLQSLQILREFSPDLVLGVGSYSSGPVLLIAHLLGISTAIHEQNVPIGAANRLLSPLVDRIYLSFQPQAGDVSRSLVVGNPVRADFSLPKTLSPSVFTVMIQGGSHGAPPLNRLVLNSLPLLAAQKSLHFIHQTGPGDLTRVQAAYEKYGISAEVFDFVPNPAPLFARANLVISRAGASTLAELAASASPALLVPLPSADNHQLRNAQPFSKTGAAELLLQPSLCPAMLANRILFYQAHPEKLAAMSCRMRTFAFPNAAKTIVDDLLDLFYRR